VAGAAGPETLVQSAANPVAVEPAVDIAAVTKRFGDVIALHEVSMRVTPGTVHGLLGPMAQVRQLCCASCSASAGRARAVSKFSAARPPTQLRGHPEACAPSQKPC